MHDCVQARILVAVHVIALALAVPTVAMTRDGEAQIDGKVTVAPANGPNGEYAAVTHSNTTIRNISDENQIYTTVAPLTTHDDS